MMLRRRQFLAGSAALGAAWLAGPLAGCAASQPRAMAVVPGVTRVQLGSVTVTTIADGFFSRTLDAGFVKNASLEQVQAALREAGLPTDKVDIPFNPVLVETGSQRILIDAGFGEFGPPTAGKTLGNLKAAGVDPKAITACVVSHFHGDHIHGLRNKAGDLVYPNAKIYVPKQEWDYWMDDARMASAPEAMKGAFAAVRRVFGPIASTVVRFEPGKDVLPGLRSEAAFGHTPGHTVFTIEGGTQRVMYWADTTNVAALFVRNPDWAVSFDMDAEAARVVRRRLADRVVREKMLLAGFHLPDGAIGTLAARGKGYEFTPLARG